MAPAFFVSYAPKDQPQLEKLEAFLLPLARSGELTYWHAGMTLAGTVSRKLRVEKLNESQLIVCLISADYLAHMEGELVEILKQKERGAIIVPVLVRQTLFADSRLQDLKSLPTDGRSISQWTSADEAWQDVGTGIRDLATAGTDSQFN